MNLELLAILEKAYQDLDLFPLLEPAEIQDFRVEYGREVLVRLKREVEASTKSGKMVFAGHRGCGKSTLLKSFAVEMQKRHFVLFFSIADVIELSDINHINILYAISLMLLSKATQAGVKIPEQTQKSLVEWLITTRTQTATQELKSELGVGGDVFKLLTAKLKQEESFRDEIKQTYERKVSELVEKANQVAGYIQAATQKPVLVVIDDLDKLDLHLVEAIYRNNIKSLFSPQFRIVFTIPVSALQDPIVMGSLTSEGIVRVQQFPVSKFFPKAESRNPEAEPIATTFKTFSEVLGKRIPAGLIDPTTAKRLVLHSGGVIRELVRIARECCTECMVRLESEPDRQTVTIDDEILTIALRNLRNDFARQLGASLYQGLVRVYQTQAQLDLDGDREAFAKLLHSLCVLEYQNDDLWYDVHPIVADLLRRRELIGASEAE